MQPSGKSSWTHKISKRKNRSLGLSKRYIEETELKEATGKLIVFHINIILTLNFKAIFTT